MEDLTREREGNTKTFFFFFLVFSNQLAVIQKRDGNRFYTAESCSGNISKRGRGGNLKRAGGGKKGNETRVVMYKS